MKQTINLKIFYYRKKSIIFIIKFKNSLIFQTFAKNFDIIYFGTSFQYFISLEEFLSKIFKLKAKYIVIADTIFLEKRNSLVTLQINTYPSIIPQKFNNIDEVINLFKNDNYNLIYKSKRKPGKHNILKKNEYFYRDLIFESFD